MTCPYLTKDKKCEITRKDLPGGQIACVNLDTNCPYILELEERLVKAEGVVEYLQVLIPQLREHDTAEAKYALDWAEGALEHNRLPLESEASNKRLEDLANLTKIKGDRG